MHAAGVGIDFVEYRVEKHERRVVKVVIESAHDLGPEAFDVSCRSRTLANLAQSKHAAFCDFPPGLFEGRVVKSHHSAIPANHGNDGP